MANCSTSQDQIDALFSVIAALRPSELASISAMTVTIRDTATDSSSFLSLSTIGCDQEPVGDQCNILSGLCQPEVGAAGTTKPIFDKM